MARTQEITKVANAFSKVWNPLRVLTKPQLERMLENYHHGSDVRMQVLFSQIEQLSPIYSVCIAKRTAGVLGREWDVLPRDERDPEAVKQAEAVKKVLLKCDERNDDGLTEAIKWLAMSTFRGRSAVKPFLTDEGLVLKKLNNWNFLEFSGNLYWNPSSEETMWLDQDQNLPPGLMHLPKSEVCYLLNDSPIDLAGMLVYLRMEVGEDAWSRATEKMGVPQCIVTVPDGTPDTAMDEWNMRAMQITEGGCGALPAGAKVDQLTDARGQDPFSDYIQHQTEMISIMATGGTMLTLPGQSGGLGSDLARVQQEQFDSLVNQDCKRIGNAFTSGVVPKVVSKLFGEDAECKCRFTFVEDAEYSADDYLSMAVKLNSIGVKVDAKLLKDMTKLSFIDDSVEESWVPKQDERKDGSWTPQEREELKKELEAEVK